MAIAVGSRANAVGVSDGNEIIVGGVFGVSTTSYTLLNALLGCFFTVTSTAYSTSLFRVTGTGSGWLLHWEVRVRGSMSMPKLTLKIVEDYSPGRGL